VAAAMAYRGGGASPCFNIFAPGTTFRNLQHISRVRQQQAHPAAASELSNTAFSAECKRDRPRQQQFVSSIKTQLAVSWTN
jgi:hypothetical protein